MLKQGRDIDEFKEKSDEEILTLSLSNPDAFSILVDRYEEPFLRKARKIIYNRIEASEDIVQDTFVKIYVHARKFTPQPGASFKSWAYKILLNTAFTYYKKLKKETRLSSPFDPEFEYLVESSDSNEFKKKLDADEALSYISKLPVTLEKVMRLYTIEHRSQKEISDSEGISAGAVRARIHRAKKELKKLTSRPVA